MNRYMSIYVEEIKNRARIYAHIYRELSKDVGQERAMEILKRAIYARGVEKGQKLASKIGAPDLHKVAADFLSGRPDMDAFGHSVVDERADHVVLRLNRCPLVNAWKEMGLSPEEQKLMCEFAYQIDFGKFEAAGYKLAFNCRIADGGTSCDLDVRL